MLGILLGLSASLAWGVGDFISASRTRLISVLSVLVCGQAVGFVWIGGIALIANEPVPAARYIVFSALGAVAGTIGLACFLRGMSVGKISLVAPIAAMAAVVPVIVGLATGDRPSALQVAGMAIALIGAALASREHDADGGGGSKLAAGVLLGAASAFAWGWFFLAIDVASDGGAVWASLVNRATSLVMLLGAVLVLRPNLREAKPHLPLLA